MTLTSSGEACSSVTAISGMASTMTRKPSSLSDSASRSCCRPCLAVLAGDVTTGLICRLSPQRIPEVGLRPGRALPRPLLTHRHAVGRHDQPLVEPLGDLGEPAFQRKLGLGGDQHLPDAIVGAADLVAELAAEG